MCLRYVLSVGKFEQAVWQTEKNFSYLRDLEFTMRSRIGLGVSVSEISLVSWVDMKRLSGRQKNLLAPSRFGYHDEISNR